MQFKSEAKKSQPNWKLTRLETWSLPGVPDVLLFDQKNRFQMVELKYTTTNAVRLSPHQISFLSSHGQGLVWLLVKKDPSSRPAEFFLYEGAAVLGVASNGLREKPFAQKENIEDIIELLADA